MISKILKARYKTLRTLSTSNMSETYLAEDIDNNCLCVVKRLQSADPSFFPDARRLFAEEAKILGKLGKYDQIPQLLDFFDEDREFYLVQKYIEGHILSHEILWGKPWPEAKIWQFLQEALEILDEVHQQGVIHRDIKPSNLIRRQEDGKLVLIDFGAVKQVQILDFDPANTPTTPSRLAYPSSRPVEVMLNTIAIGTPGYMPLEQYRGKPRLSSDLYALGMVAIQALTGLSPTQLPEDEDGEIIWQDEVKVSPELATFLNKMVRSHFRERYQDAGEALKALQVVKPLSVTSPVKTVVAPQKARLQKKSHYKPLLWFINSIGIVSVCFIFLKITENHQYIEAQQEIQEVKSFLNNHQLQNCIAKTESILQDYQSNIFQNYDTLHGEARQLGDRCRLTQAKTLIEKGNNLEAIKIDSLITKTDRKLYLNAQLSIDLSIKEILSTATKQYQLGKFEEVKNIGQNIIKIFPEQTYYHHKNTQKLLDTWKKEWKDDREQFQRVKSALDRHNWLQAEKLADDIQHLYWQKQAKQTIELKYESILQTAKTQYRDGYLRKAVVITNFLKNYALKVRSG